MWKHPCIDCVCPVFGTRAGFGLDARHVFPVGMLDVITLSGGVVGVVESRAWAGC